MLFFRRSYFLGVIKRIGKIADCGHKKGKDFGKWAAHLHKILLLVRPMGIIQIYSQP